MTQELAVNIFEQSSKLTIPKRGDIWLRIRPDNSVQVGTEDKSGLLWDGILYPFSAFFVRHDDTWRLRADTLTFKAPAKIKNVLLLSITQRVNEFMAAQGDLEERMEAWRLQQQHQSLRRSMRDSEQSLEYAHQRMTEAAANRARNYLALEAFLNEHPEFNETMQESE